MRLSVEYLFCFIIRKPNNIGFSSDVLFHFNPIIITFKNTFCDDGTYLLYLQVIIRTKYFWLLP